jgi:hypothetical protein
MTTRNVLYIAGPITDVPDYQQRFATATDQARAAGWQVINPAALPSGMTEAAYMDICCAFVRNCDAVLMLPGWEASVGANIEHDLAFKCGKRVYYGAL